MDDPVSNEKKGHQRDKMETLKIKAQTSNGFNDVNVVGAPSNVKVPPPVTFHPDKHCGVWLIVEKRRCLRSLTCKLHSILLKRKVEGRSRPYDELMRLRKVKIEMEAASGANSQISSSSSASSSSSRSSITETVIEPPETASPTLANGSSRPEFALLKIKPRKMFYTSTHSNPLALCSFNVKRIGGFVFCTRSKSLTDKLVKISPYSPIGQGSKTKKLNLIELRMIKSIWPSVINDSLLFNVKRVRSIAPESRVPDLNDDNNNLSEEVVNCGEDEEVIEEVVFTIDAEPLDLENPSWVGSCAEQLSGLEGHDSLENAFIVIDDLTEGIDRDNHFPLEGTSSTWEVDSKEEEVVNVEDVVSVDHIENFSDPPDEHILRSLKVTKPKKRKRKRWF